MAGADQARRWEPSAGFCHDPPGVLRGRRRWEIKERLRNPRFEPPGVDLDFDGHYLRSALVNQLPAIRTPKGLLAARCGNLPFPSLWREILDIDLPLAGLVSGIGDPFPIPRNVTFVVVKRSGHHRKWLPTAGHRNRPDLPRLFKTTGG